MSELSMLGYKAKLMVVINVEECKMAFAKEHNVRPEDVEVTIKYETEPKPKGVGRSKPTSGPVVGKAGQGAKTKTFLYFFLRDKGFETKEAAELCGVSRTTINRACVGQRLRVESFNQIVKGMEMTPEQAKEFKKSLNFKQRNYHHMERMGEPV